MKPAVTHYCSSSKGAVAYMGEYTMAVTRGGVIRIKNVPMYRCIGSIQGNCVNPGLCPAFPARNFREVTRYLVINGVYDYRKLEELYKKERVK